MLKKGAHMVKILAHWQKLIPASKKYVAVGI